MRGRHGRDGAATPPTVARSAAALPLLLCTLLLGACATLPPAAPAPTPWAQRLAALQATSHFELQGRLAASTGNEGFSAGLRWQQQDDRATIDLSAPLGFGAAHIEQTAENLQLTTSKGVTLDSTAASDELRATLGFEPPLGSLRFWILGASDPATERTAVARRAAATGATCSREAGRLITRNMRGCSSSGCRAASP